MDGWALFYLFASAGKPKKKLYTVNRRIKPVYKKIIIITQWPFSSTDDIALPKTDKVSAQKEILVLISINNKRMNGI